MNNGIERNKKILYSIIAIFITFVFLIITLSVILKNIFKQEAKISNDSGRDSAIISDQEISRVRTEVYKSIKDIYTDDYYKDIFPNGIDNIGDKDVELGIRWNTVQKNEGSTSFLADFDEYRQTYRIYIAEDEILLTCPKVSESKYPESFCVGNSGDSDDSITAVFGSALPYSGQTEDGYEYTVMRDKNSRKNGSITVLSYSCGPKEEVQTQVTESVDELISSLGASPNLFKKDISISCLHGE